MKNYAFLFWAYNTVWIGLAVYLLFLMVRLGKLSSRVEGIERDLERHEG